MLGNVPAIIDELMSTAAEPARVDSAGEVLDEHRAGKPAIRGLMDDYFEVKRAAPPGPQPDLHKEPPPEIKPETKPESEAKTTPEETTPETKPDATTTRRTITPTAPGDTRPGGSTTEGEEFAPTGDEEIDKFDLGPNTRKQTKSQFHNVKTLWHKDRSELTKAQQELQQTRAQLEQLKTQGGTGQPDPAIQERLKRADDVLRTLDIQNWPTFQEKYVKPIQDKWRDVVTLVGDALGAQTDPAKKDWADKLLAAGPDALSKEWWQNQLKEIPDEDDRAEARAGLRQIQSLKRERDRFAQENSGPDKFKEIRQQSDEEFTKNFYKEVEKAAGELEKELGIGDWGKPKALPEKATDEEKTAIETHNRRFQDYQKQFVDFMTLSTKPDTPAKDRTRLCMMAVQAIHQKSEMADKDSQIKTLTERNKVLEAQLNKAVKAKSAPDARGTPATTRVTQQAPVTQRNGSTSAARTKNAMDEFFER